MCWRVVGKSFSVLSNSLLFGLLAAVSISAQQSTQGGDAGFGTEEGLQLLKDGNIAAACERFRAVIQRNPERPAGYIYLGIAENQGQRFADAAEAFQQAIRLDADSEAAHYNLALSCLGLHQIAQAEREFRAVVRLNPANQPAHYNLGLLLEQRNALAEACQHLEAARSLKPGDVAVWLHLENLYLARGREENARQLVRESQAVDSDGVLSLQLGKLLVDRNHFGEAVGVLETAERHQPDSLECKTYLARAYLETKQAARADALLATLRDDQATWDTCDMRGLAAMQLEQRGAAVEYFSKAMQMHPSEASVHNHLGQLLLASTDKRDRAAGENEMQRAIALDPTKAEYYLTLSGHYFDSGNMEAAIHLLQSGLSQVPPSLPLYVVLALSELELHGPAEAEPFVRKAMDLGPQAGAGYDLLGRCRMREDKYAEAARYFQKAAELTPNNDMYLRDAALALEKTGAVADAVPFAQRAIQLKPSAVYSHYIAGKLYSETGDRNRAIRELETCLTLDPKNPIPYNLLATLYKRSGEDAKAAACWRTLRGLKQQDIEKEEQTFLRLSQVLQ